jgi:hypothetical protein
VPERLLYGSIRISPALNFDFWAVRPMQLPQSANWHKNSAIGCLKGYPVSNGTIWISPAFNFVFADFKIVGCQTLATATAGIILCSWVPQRLPKRSMRISPAFNFVFADFKSLGY